MSEGQPENKDLIFENTPLQNLKNILSEVDASAQVNLSEPSVGTAKGAPKSEGVSKAKIQRAIDDLTGLPGQQVSLLTIGQIVDDLCGKPAGADQKSPFNALDHAAVVNLEAILKNFNL